MSSDSDGSDDAAALRERVRQLETRLAEQQETIDEQQSHLERLMPDRRQVMTGLVGLGGLALGAGGATAADTTDGTVGSKVIQTREVRDQNDNLAIDLPGSGGTSISALTLTGNADFQQNEAQGMVLETVSGDPSSPVTGQIWYDTSAD